MIKKQNKKGYFFSLDALVALLIILSVVLFIKSPSTNVSHEENFHEDLLEVLSSIKIGDLNNSYSKSLISQGKITNLNQSVLEQIGEFYANSSSDAQLLTISILNDLNLSKNVGIYFNNVIIATQGTNPSNASNIETTRQIISGIQAGSSVKGYSSRAFLSSDKRVDYFYFGGYIGDGNISVKLTGDIIGANIEGVFSGNFSIYINNQTAGNYTPTPNIPYKLNLAPYLNKFTPGDNIVDFKSSSNLYIAGGYIRVVYNNSNVQSLNGFKNIPGISGLINIYDSFYVPAVITSLEVKLHYNSSYDIFMSIGNKTVYTGNSSGNDTSVVLDDNYFQTIFSSGYPEIRARNVPFRIGLNNASYIQNLIKPVDVVSANDISGSMAATNSSCSGGGSCCSGGVCKNNQTKCLQCGGTFNPAQNKIGESKNATKKFIDIILNSSLNRIGLAAYSTNAEPFNTYPLSNNSVALKSEVDSWSAGGGTCICCGINRAVNQLATNSSSNKSRSTVVMSDGIPNYYCDNYTDYTGSPEFPTPSGDYPVSTQWAVNAACKAYNNYNISVYAIGFGNDVNMTVMQLIASCGHGSSYFGNVSQLESIYNQVAQNIITAAYQEQTVTGTGFSTRLYPDSYINISYTKSIPYGLVIVAESNTFNNNASQGDFYIPNDTVPYEARVVSYSGSKWTSQLEKYNSSDLSWKSIFNLSSFGSNFTLLGDPYSIYIPKSEINYGNNTVRVSVGLDPGNSSAGSIYNKVIYSVVKNLSSYSPILSTAIGCRWTIEFEDGSNSTINVPASYSGANTCLYSSSGSSYDNNDAIDYAIFSLLSQLDLNSNGKLETKFADNDLSLDTIEVTGIPFTWETEVQVRTWR
ncbi:VWA domain-containing protein [Candidatus Pacearchaeota archaeon]|nr:VWA domain-containing protein [Candidatus Pacearchaeota archaeon]